MRPPVACPTRWDVVHTLCGREILAVLSGYGSGVTASSGSRSRGSQRSYRSTPAPPRRSVSVERVLLDGSTLVEIRRSLRRRRTISAHVDGDHIVVSVPARLSRAEREKWVRIMVERLARRRGRQDAADSDQRLLRRAVQLSRRYLGGRAQPASVRWVANQESRWGSCTPESRSIRLSKRLQVMPSWVRDYVLLHELVHLIDPTHGPRFHALLNQFPWAERAKGYLQGISDAALLRSHRGSA